MGRSRRGRVASSGGASSVVGERGTMTEKRNLYLYLYLYLSAISNYLKLCEHGGPDERGWPTAGGRKSGFEPQC